MPHNTSSVEKIKNLKIMQLKTLQLKVTDS